MSDLGLPFLTREMLRFEQATKFSLVVESCATIATTIVITGATRNGPFTLKHITVATEVPQEQSFALPDIPIWISAKSSVIDTFPNEIYVQLSFALNDDIMQPLCAGYLYGLSAVAWPMNNIEPPIPYEWGFTKQYTDPAPAAGSDFTWTNLPYAFSEIQAVSFTLTTSATVANRRVHLQIYDGGLASLDFHSSVDQTASQTRRYTCAAIGGAGSYANDDNIIIPIPAGLKGANEFTIGSDTLNLQAGDQFSQVVISLIEKRSTMYF